MLILMDTDAKKCQKNKAAPLVWPLLREVSLPVGGFIMTVVLFHP